MKRLIRRTECIQRLAIGRTKFHSDIVARPGASEHIPGTDVPRLNLVHLGPRFSAAIEDELEEVIEGLRAARRVKPPDVRNDAAPKRKRGRASGMPKE
jgi:predicted DNA-binding transcriptional regulator AlpA